METHNLVELEIDLASRIHREPDEWLSSFEYANFTSSEPGDPFENQAVIQHLRDHGYIERCRLDLGKVDCDRGYKQLH